MTSTADVDPDAVVLDKEFQRQADKLADQLDRAAANIRRYARNVDASLEDGRPDYSAKLTDILREATEALPHAELYGLMQAAANADRHARRPAIEPKGE